MAAAASHNERLVRRREPRRGSFQVEPGWLRARDSAKAAFADELSIGFVGTYPPTRCGIASFTASLARAMAQPGSAARVGVVACVDQAGVIARPAEVVAELVPGSAASRSAAARRLDTFDVVVVQHEFGIFGGDDGCEIVDLVQQLHAPVIVVLHTVQRQPTPGQQAVVERLARLAERVVAQSNTARTRLLATHVVDPGKVVVIPHGAPAPLATEPSLADPTRRPVILTWGLLGPSKGIEWAIDALALLRDLEPQPRFVVAGQTHPRILETDGEAYRESLLARANDLELNHMIEFDNAYRDLGATMRRIREADVVLLPYLSLEQVVSGVLVEAIAGGKPVVSTRFPHAEELLGGGSGILVAHRDPVAIADALRSLFTDVGRMARMVAVARRQAPALFWENVGASYLRLADELLHGSEQASVAPIARPAAAARLVTKKRTRLTVGESYAP